VSKTGKTKKQRAFLKWAGGKYNLVEAINQHLPATSCLVEPFVGAASVFLNTDYERYVLNDINADLIDMYRIIQSDAGNFIKFAREWFNPEWNDKARYIEIRQRFNLCTDPFERAQLFLYINRHCFNGLCRYNQSGQFNVPFGKYKKPYFPEAELWAFAEKAQRATFTCQSYQQVFAQLPAASAVYCDPPYVPLSKTASFTSYAKNSFGLDDQADLASLAEAAQQQGHAVLISNHDTSWTRKIYQGAELHTIQVGRSISQKGSTRGKVAELFALYR
jgi:DNA adenine methylase